MLLDFLSVSPRPSGRYSITDCSRHIDIHDSLHFITICRMFSLQSDIWSYGVVLWELFSLARSPYPGLEPNEEFIRRLEAGHRMEKPSHATDEL